MIVLDTHVVIWWANQSTKLSSRAKHVIEEEQTLHGDILISAISAWEIAVLIQKGRLTLSMDVETWLNLIDAIEEVKFIPIDRTIGVNATTLPGKFHKDPADRIIVATARRLSASLVTADEKILGYKHVQSVW